MSQSNTRIVLIHGLAGSRLVMWPLAWQFQRAGFSTTTFGYPSWWWTIEHHAKQFSNLLDQVENDSTVSRFHIVAHSMGCIVTRQSLLQARYAKLDRIVMLAAPNHGSPVARVLGTVLPFCTTLRQLSDRPSSFVCNLPPPQDLEIGVIAARHDRVIPERKTHLPVETDHISLFSGHNGLLVRSTAARQAIAFVESGQFVKS